MNSSAAPIPFDFPLSIARSRRTAFISSGRISQCGVGRLLQSRQCSKSFSDSTSSLNSIGRCLQIGFAKSAIVSKWAFRLANGNVGNEIIAVLCVCRFHAVCTPFCGSLCGKLLTGINTPFAISSARMAAFFASISAFFFLSDFVLVSLLRSAGFALEIVLMKPVLAFLTLADFLNGRG